MYSGATRVDFEVSGSWGEFCQASLMSGVPLSGGKATTQAVTITRDEQKALEQQQLAEIAERRAKQGRLKVGRVKEHPID